MRHTLLLTALILLAGCRQDTAMPEIAFYHWQTSLELDHSEQAYLDSLEASRLYVKFFDIDWDAGRSEAVPTAALEVKTRPGIRQIIPTVFITNRVFQNLPEKALEQLAGRTLDKITHLAAGFTNVIMEEIQIDCDWTDSTRQRYFTFLKHLRRQLKAQNTRLSATIRLHQVRYFDRTGVPPVDRGMLMFYNMGDLQEWEEPNSILNNEKAAPYLEGLEAYPLPLDLALPLFRWGVVFRDGHLVRLINGLDAKELADPGRFVKKGGGRFQVVKSTYLDGYYLYEGDRIRLETVDAASLKTSAALLRSYFTHRPFVLAFYHLDRATIKQVPHGQLEEIISILSSP